MLALLFFSVILSPLAIHAFLNLMDRMAKRHPAAGNRAPRRA